MPRRRGLWLWPAAIVVAGIVFSALLIAARDPSAGPMMRILSGLAVFGLFVAYGVSGYLLSHRARRERAAVEAIEEMVLLRRWPDAAAALYRLLDEPMLSHGARVQALLYLSSVLSRYHQFADAVHVHDYLLEHVQLDGGLGVTLRMARAMALLRDDRLFDADRAIAELRRMPSADKIAGVAMVEMYRDVKTGHPNEAIEIFKERLAQFGPQLGHRAADAFVLAAKAFEQVGDEATARGWYEKATLLAPPMELARRVPEVAAMVKTWVPAAAPPEAA